MIYNLFAFPVKLLKLKGNTSGENTEKNICKTAWILLPIGVFSIVFCIASYSFFFSPAAWQSSGPNRWFIFYVSIFCMVTETTTLYLLHHEFQRLCSILTVICQSAYSITSIRSIIKLVTNFCLIVSSIWWKGCKIQFYFLINKTEGLGFS